jgi:hypothetical protein
MDYDDLMDAWGNLSKADRIVISQASQALGALRGKQNAKQKSQTRTRLKRAIEPKVSRLSGWTVFAGSSEARDIRARAESFAAGSRAVAAAWKELPEAERRKYNQTAKRKIADDIKRLGIHRTAHSM